jgi:hypothetical protein
MAQLSTSLTDDDDATVYVADDDDETVYVTN